MTKVLAFILAAAVAAQAQTPKIELSPPVTAAFAGVKVSMPKGYDLQLTSDRYTVLRAAKLENDEAVVSVSISAVPVSPQATFASFVDMAKPTPTLVLRNLKVLKIRRLRMAGLDGEVRITSFEFRGVQATAVTVFLLRPVPSVPMQMGYVLSVEGEKSRGKELLPVLAAVGESLELSDPVRPLSQKIDSLGGTIVSKRWGYTIDLPQWWKGRLSRDRDQVVMDQTDYLRGGVPMPQAKLVVFPEPGTAEVCAKTALRALQQTMRERKMEFETVREGPARMADRDGYEFVVQQIVPPATTQQAAAPEPVVVAQRTVCVGGISYSLQVIGQTDKLDQVTSVLEAIAAGVVLSAPQTTMPATAPSATAPDVLPPVAPPALPSILPSTAPTTGPRGMVVPKYE